MVGAMTIAENLKRHRDEAGLSQNQLAKLAGVSQQLISQLERGANDATTKLPRIAKALGVAVEAIDPAYAVMTDAEDRRSDALRHLHEVANQLDDHDQRRVAAFAEGLLRTSPRTERTE
jgi:transcriptional regulator with XRE-family HTH domain